MNIFLCGQKHFGCLALRLLLSLGHQITGVSSPAWRNERLPLEANGEEPDRLRAEADQHGLAWLPAGRMTALNLPAGLDLIIAAHSHDYISERMRLKTKLGAIGFHPSLLPLHRGRDAVRWAIKMRDRVTGGSVYWLNNVVDGGPIAAQEWCFVRPDDTAESLWRRELQPMGIRLFAAVLADLGRGVVVSLPQDAALATWEPAIDPPRLHRPDLTLIGSMPGYRIISDPARLAEERARGLAEMRLAAYQ
jgi:methionyl-tRNA formyltransferase